jgi:hypothetical protein
MRFFRHVDSIFIIDMSGRHAIINVAYEVSKNYNNITKVGCRKTIKEIG